MLFTMLTDKNYTIRSHYMTTVVPLKGDIWDWEPHGQMSTDETLRLQGRMCEAGMLGKPLPAMSAVQMEFCQIAFQPPP